MACRRLGSGLGSAAVAVEGPTTLDINGSGPDADLDHEVIQAVGGSLEVNGVLREVEEVLLLQHILEETGKTIHVETVGEAHDDSESDKRRCRKKPSAILQKGKSFYQKQFSQIFKAEKSKDC